jgi:hypothetical protein
MKRLFFLVVASTLTTIVWAESLTDTIGREAQQCANALVSGHYETFARCTNSKVVSALGGKEAMISVLKRGETDMRKKGIRMTSASIGTIDEPKKIGPWLTSKAALHLVMSVPGGKLHQDSTLLALSDDGGKRWTFVDLASGDKQGFDKIFPELKGQITFPEKREPQFVKEGNN